MVQDYREVNVHVHVTIKTIIVLSKYFLWEDK